MMQRVVRFRQQQLRYLLWKIPIEALIRHFHCHTAQRTISVHKDIATASMIFGFGLCEILHIRNVMYPSTRWTSD